MKDKIVIITGGTRGIGLSMVKVFTKAQAKVIFTYRSSSAQAEKLALETGSTAFQSDASNFQACTQLIEQVVKDYGRIDVLINNAGITSDNLLLRMSEEQWDTVMNINLKSAFNLTKNVIRPMMKQRTGSIINISSVVGVFGNAGQANYAASKAGLIGFTKSMAKELGSRNIRCNAIAPGFIITDMTENLDENTSKKYIDNIPLNKFGTGQDIADACIFLASDQSKYITGQVISVCGGMNI